MKKSFLNLFIVLILSLFILVGCGDDTIKTDEVLRVYNWQDYIASGLDDDGNKVKDSVIEAWEKDYKARTGKTVTLIYDTFETNENMLNVLKTGKAQYDLVCPSDYMIQKMIANDMLEKFTYSDNKLTNIENYNKYGSFYLTNLFKEKGWSEYAVPYMWGTMGFVYNPETVSHEDVKTWNVLWNEQYNKKSTVKNSVRDTYVVGVMHVYYDELVELANKFKTNQITLASYNNSITEIMNRTDDLTIGKVENALLSLKDNIYGFEVDNGKTDITTGRIQINFAWSGDAVYSMDKAEEDANMNLYYSVPEEGSNVWFDGWVMPKGANKTLAEDFLNFLSSPSVARQNMEAIGYTSSIAGDEIFDLIKEWYGDDEGESVDLSYFFNGTLSDSKLTDGKAIVKVSERGRQFDAQYPSEDVINRCAIMEDFGERNDAVLSMWENIKSGTASIYLWIILGVFAVGGVTAVIIASANKRSRRKRRPLSKRK